MNWVMAALKRKNIQSVMVSRWWRLPRDECYGISMPITTTGQVSQLQPIPGNKRFLSRKGSTLTASTKQNKHNRSYRYLLQEENQNAIKIKTPRMQETNKE
jgi:hypothetical protein